MDKDGYHGYDKPVIDESAAKRIATALGWEPKRTWVGLMRGVRVEGDTVVIAVKGGNDAARELCGYLLNEIEVRRGND